MPTIYCSAKCGKPIKYESARPTKCPYCEGSLIEAFQPAVAKVIGEVDEVAVDPLDRPIQTQPLSARKGITTDIEGEFYDKREARRLAQELASSIDPASITISDDDEGTVSFAQLWKEGETARAAGSTGSKKPSKRRR